MKNFILFFIYIMCTAFIVLSCSKDNNSGNLDSGDTGTSGSLARFTIYGDYLYTVDHSTLKTYSLSNPQKPELVSAVTVGWDIETIYPYDGNLFIGSMNAMYIFSLEDPSKPKEKGVASHLRACDPVVAYNDYSYVTVRSNATCGGTINALLVYDVKEQNKPIQIGNVSLKEPHGLGIRANTLYVCDGSFGLKVFDISNPKSPAELTCREGYKFLDCIPYNDMLICMVSKGMVIYDISNPNSPEFVTATIQ